MSAVWNLFAAGPVLYAAGEAGLGRSVDGGRTWRRVLRGEFFRSVTRGPNGYVALGSASDSETALTATSTDGIHWRVVRDRNQSDRVGGIGFGDRVAASGPAIVTVGNDQVWPGVGPMLRSVDGGRRWENARDMRYPQGGLQALPDGSLVATGYGGDQRCDGAVFRSVDGGATWVKLPGSCTRMGLFDVQFLDAEHGVAVGGGAEKSGGGQIIETTADAGATWTVTRYRPPTDNPSRQTEAFGGVLFLTPSTGFVSVGVCVDGANGPCAFKTNRTDDSGTHLVGVPASAGAPFLTMATAGPRRWIGSRIDKDWMSLSMTRDAGRHWYREALPTQLNGASLYGAANLLIWATPLGRFVSRDGGRAWQHLHDLRAVRRQLARLRMRTPASTGGYWCVSSTYRSETWKACQVGLGPRTVLRYRATPTAALITRRIPNWVGNRVQTIVATGPHTAVFANNGALWRSHDNAQTWHETWPRLPGEGRHHLVHHRPDHRRRQRTSR